MSALVSGPFAPPASSPVFLFLQSPTRRVSVEQSLVPDQIGIHTATKGNKKKQLSKPNERKKRGCNPPEPPPPL
ncbi:uncharacterized protein BDV17DRAFT_260079 [Aspergillus undulatus]|uniref:uncharacterized protein n=1 Tax=Aspergillus undulatus TaxID=1810928 RepID=UPI003CCD8A21